MSEPTPSISLLFDCGRVLFGSRVAKREAESESQNKEKQIWSELSGLYFPRYEFAGGSGWSVVLEGLSFGSKEG